jgi:hypothetical protein
VTISSQNIVSINATTTTTKEFDFSCVNDCFLKSQGTDPANLDFIYIYMKLGRLPGFMEISVRQ